MLAFYYETGRSKLRGSIEGWWPHKPIEEHQRKGWNGGITRRKIRRTFLTLIPAFLSPIACLFLNSVTIEIGFNPAFSASVVGITSNASAYAWKQYASFPLRV
jgi:hypothetical protein